MAAHAPRISQAHPTWSGPQTTALRGETNCQMGPPQRRVLLSLLLTGSAVRWFPIWGPVQYRPRNHITVTVPGPKESYNLNHNFTEMEQGGQKGGGDGGNRWFTTKGAGGYALSYGVNCQVLAGNSLLDWLCIHANALEMLALIFLAALFPFLGRCGEGTQYCHPALNNKGKRARNLSYYVPAICYKFYAVK